MYYPFKKQINKVYNINKNLNVSDIFKIFVKQTFIILFKIIGLILIIFFMISFFRFIKIEIMYSKISVNEIVIRANVLLDTFNYWIFNLNELSSSIERGIVSDIFNLILNILTSSSSDLNNAINALVNAPSEPITSETLSNYLYAANTFYILSFEFTMYSLIFGSLPFGLDFEIAFEGIAKELFTLGDMVIDKYNTTIIPLIDETNNLWMSLVYPLTSIINTSLMLLTSFTGVAFMMPILIGNQGTSMGLPTYFWLFFAVSLLLMILFAIINLVKISSNSDKGERNKTIKNFTFGFVLTITSFIVIPIIFGSIIIFFALIIESLFGVSLLADANLTTNSISLMLVSNSVKGNAQFLGDLSHPYAYMDGEIILLTKTYFDYTMFSVFAIITFICLFILSVIVLVNIFSILQYLIIGPIVSLMYMRDGIIVFSNWFRNLIKLFFVFTIIVLQILLMVELANVFNTSLNDVVSYSKLSLMMLFVLLFVSSIVSIFVFSRSISNIFFKDYKVKAEIKKGDMDGVKVDANVKNNTLKVSDDNLSRTLKTNINKVQKNNNKNLKIFSKKIEDIGKNNLKEIDRNGKNR